MSIGIKPSSFRTDMLMPAYLYLILERLQSCARLIPGTLVLHLKIALVMRFLSRLDMYAGKHIHVLNLGFYPI